MNILYSYSFNWPFSFSCRTTSKFAIWSGTFLSDHRSWNIHLRRNCRPLHFLMWYKIMIVVLNKNKLVFIVFRSHHLLLFIKYVDNLGYFIAWLWMICMCSNLRYRLNLYFMFINLFWFWLRLIEILIIIVINHLSCIMTWRGQRTRAF